MQFSKSESKIHAQFFGKSMRLYRFLTKHKPRYSRYINWPCANLPWVCINDSRPAYLPAYCETSCIFCGDFRRCTHPGTQEFDCHLVLIPNVYCPFFGTHADSFERLCHVIRKTI